ncbi:non-specific lipid transfer protein GPI-anchored 2-like [Panicum virgatum]|uniref:non-specific lipid transfer protein GPI-anchored 2-like n=1 Tax=Panicum virgatum TaxID=38727 RepID=UPI0019D54941|nr:non-specific lipid transfer protein GPI-anchored 2-like [Panicum virgatum]
MTSLLNMSDCLGYVTKGSTARWPDAPCCPELTGLVGSNPVCLCELLSGAADSYGIAVDYDRALALPGICRVATPPVSTCTAMGYHVRVGPAAAPMSGSPSPMSGMAPSGVGPLFPGTSPAASPPSSTSHAARRSSSGGGIHLTALAMLALAAATNGLLYVIPEC